MTANFLRLRVLGALLLAVMSHAEMRTRGAEPQMVDVFINGSDDNCAYRIPSLICTAKGTLLAFCEGRKISGADESPTDLVLKRSLDGGKTWRAMQIIVKAAPECAANPTAVVDRTTGDVLLVYDLWPELVKEEFRPEHMKRAPGFGRNSVTTWITTSSDEGATWSKPVDITRMTKRVEWTRTCHGPGMGIQTRSGRLVIPCFENKPTEGPWGVSWNYIIYSDDHGKTWRLSDTEAGPGVNETQIVELADGTLLLNMRSERGKGCRAGATSKDGGNTWSELFDIPELPDLGCQGSIFRYTWPDAQGKSRILFSKPATPERNVGAIRLSYDEGKTWPIAKVLHQDYFGYSCLAGMPDGTVGCLFEAANCSKLAFTSFSLEWLTDGNDSLR